MRLRKAPGIHLLRGLHSPMVMQFPFQEQEISLSLTRRDTMTLLAGVLVLLPLGSAMRKKAGSVD